MTANPTDADAARARLAEALVRTGSEDRGAFRDLYTLTRSKLFGICLRICGERQAAEDVLHDVYLTIWKRAGAWEPGRASPITWLATIARNRSIDWRRAQTVRASMPIEDAPEIADDAPDAETMLLSAESVHRLHRCLDALEPRQREAIRTAFFDGVTYAELAERGAVPLGTMKSWVRRGLARLKDCLDVSDDRILDGGPDAGPDMAAAELALGILEGDERATALRRVLAEPAFAREVDAWRLHFAQLFDLWPEVAPSDAVGHRIEASVGGDRVSPKPAPAWPILAIVTSAIAACLLLFVVTRPTPPAPAPVTPAPVAQPTSVLVASIDPIAKGAPLAALYDPSNAVLRINASVAVDARSSPQLWIIAGDGVPHSLGLLRADATSLAVDTANRSRIGEGATLAVSIEPLGGSPKPTPTGPVVASGKLQRV